jgi:hypothetical protein
LTGNEVFFNEPIVDSFFRTYFLVGLSLQTVFGNYKFNRSITVIGVGSGYLGFGMSSSNPIHYYVTNRSQGRIFDYREDWGFFSARESFTYARSIITIKNYLYIAGD